MTDLIEEVEDDLRAERLRARLRRAAPLAAVSVVVVLAAIAVWQIRVRAAERRDVAASAAYFEAIRTATEASAADPSGQAAVAANGFAPIADAARDPAGIRMLAGFRAAADETLAGHAPAAIGRLDAIAADAAVPTAWRQLATLMSVQLQVDGLAPASAIARLRPLEVAGQPYASLALETEAMVELAHDGRARAKSLLSEAVASDGTGATQRERDSTLLEALAASGGKAGG